MDGYRYRRGALRLRRHYVVPELRTGQGTHAIGEHRSHLMRDGDDFSCRVPYLSGHARNERRLRRNAHGIRR